jgi:hypothetical protein
MEVVMKHYQAWLKTQIRKLDGSGMTDDELNALNDEDWDIITRTFNTYVTSEMVDEMYSRCVGLSRSALYGIGNGNINAIK